MGIAARFQAYAEAFEQTYEDDDWSRLEPFFTEQAVYEADGEAKGRDAVFARLKAGIDGLDRQMDRRIPDFDPLETDGDTVTMTWRVTYRKADLPDLVISGVETAVFEGDRIARLRDVLDPPAIAALQQWMGAHGAVLGGS